MYFNLKRENCRSFVLPSFVRRVIFLPADPFLGRQIGATACALISLIMTSLASSCHVLVPLSPFRIAKTSQCPDTQQDESAIPHPSPLQSMHSFGQQIMHSLNQQKACNTGTCFFIIASSAPPLHYHVVCSIFCQAAGLKPTTSFLNLLLPFFLHQLPTKYTISF